MTFDIKWKINSTQINIQYLKIKDAAVKNMFIGLILTKDSNASINFGNSFAGLSPAPLGPHCKVQNQGEYMSHSSFYQRA